MPTPALKYEISIFMSLLDPLTVSKNGCLESSQTVKPKHLNHPGGGLQHKS